MDIYYTGETYICTANIYNKSHNLVDASTITCEIVDPNGSNKFSGSMTHVSTGIYSAKYDILNSDSVGEWTSIVTAVDIDGNTEVEIKEFDVKRVRK